LKEGEYMGQSLELTFYDGLTDEERSNILKELAYDYKFYKRLFKIIYNKPQLRYDVASILCKIEKDYSFYK
jgi:hypothetical protein